MQIFRPYKYSFYLDFCPLWHGIDLISNRIFYHLPKRKFILHKAFFNMATGIQIKFHEDTMKKSGSNR